MTSDLINYYVALFFVLAGLYAMITENNLIRKVIGMTLVQMGVILFFVSLSAKKNAAIPIVPADELAKISAAEFANPLPHALMLTAIVVGVSTLGVALVLIVSIYRTHKTLEEDEILTRLKS